MKGTLTHIEHRIGWIAIRDEIGEITIAELLGGYDVAVGNSISGNLRLLGGNIFTNLSTNESLHVFVEYIGLTEHQCIDIIKRRRR